MIRFKVYTRISEADPKVYPAGLAGSVHLAYKNESGDQIPLNKNYGILFVKGEISAEDTIVPMGIRNPRIFDQGNGIINIYADIYHENGEPVTEYTGKVFLWKTTDLIHFEEAGIVDKDSLPVDSSSDELDIGSSVAQNAIRYWTPITCTGVKIPPSYRYAGRHRIHALYCKDPRE